VSPEQLEQLVAAADLAAITEAFRSMPETERRKLSKTASGLLREIEKSLSRPDLVSTPSISDRLRHWLKGREVPGPQDQWRAAQLAVLAVCPLTDAKRVNARFIGCTDDGHVAKVVTDRRPEWIDDWVDLKLKPEWKQIDWGTLRYLITAGVCRKPTCDGYIQLMAGEMATTRTSEGSFVLLSQQLLADSDLLKDEIWRLFEVETAAFAIDWESDPHVGPEYESWSGALKRLSGDGHVDRQRLLDASLAGLSTGFKNNTLTGFIKFHERLEPTVEEMDARQRTYLDLLSSKAAHVVTFALRMLSEIDKAGRLDAAAFVASTAPVMGIRTQTQPKAALAILHRCGERQPELKAAAALIAVDAVAHETPEIQKQALDLLAKWSDDLGPDVPGRLAERLDDLAPSCRPLAEQLLAKLAAGAPEPPREVRADDADACRDDLLARAERLAPQWRQRAGVDAAIEALTGTDAPAPLDFNLLEVPLLTGVAPIEPIKSLDELIDAVSHAVETVDSADEVERILDGVSRLCDQKPADFERRTGPLLKRVLKMRDSPNAHGLAGGWGPQRRFTLTLTAWLQRDVSPPGKLPYEPSDGPFAFWKCRLEELANRVATGMAAPLLAAPTHTRGWIDPHELVQRLHRLQEQALEPLMFDLVQALLRLAPDHRSEAREEADSLTHPVGRAVRWALGADETPKRGDRAFSAAWLAAGRARWPQTRIDELTVLGLDPAFPDAVEPARYAWTTCTTQTCVQGKTYHHANLDLKTSPCQQPQEWSPELATVMLHATSEIAFNFGYSWLVHWANMIWPVNPSPILAVGIKAMLWRIDCSASSSAPNHGYLDVLLAPDLPWSEMARLAIWIAMAGQDADARGLAVDVMIEGIQDGRAHPRELAEVLVKLTRGGWLKLNRLRAALGEVARVSSLHAQTVAHLLTDWLSGLSELPEDAHHLLGLLLELLIQLGLPVAPASRGILQGFKGSGKTAKLVKSLLNLQPDAPATALREAQLGHLRVRIERAERWAASDGK